MMRGTFRRACGLLLGGACALLTAVAAEAHPLPGSAVLLDFQRDSVEMELHLPLTDLEIGFTHDRGDASVSAARLGPIPLTSDPSQVLPRYDLRLRTYLARHIQPEAPDGRPWTVAVESLQLDDSPPPTQDLVAHLRLMPPAGAPVGRFLLRYDVITHEIMTHEALVSVRGDWNNGRLTEEPQLLGRIRWVVKSVQVTRPEGGAWAGVKTAFQLGLQHIAEGTDHLMFLLALLLPAPLLAAGRRWGAPRGVTASLRHLLGIVTAFTVGHSVTLIAGGQGWLTLPPAPVEVAIAASILVSALHAWRPLFPGREPWVAGGFGLIHGAAFSSVVAGLHFDAWHRTMAILGFNLGIEAMQLVVVAAVLPALLLLSRLPVYRWVRLPGAAFAGLAALGWVLERTVGWPSPLSPVVDAIAAHAGWWVAGMTAVALAATFRRGGRAGGAATYEIQ